MEDPAREFSTYNAGTAEELRVACLAMEQWGLEVVVVSSGCESSFCVEASKSSISDFAHGSGEAPVFENVKEAAKRRAIRRAIEAAGRERAVGRAYYTRCTGAREREREREREGVL